MIKRREAPRLTNHLFDCSVSSWVVVMVQWLAHLTCNPGNAVRFPLTAYLFFIQNGSVSISYWLVTTSLDFQFFILNIYIIYTTLYFYVLSTVLSTVLRKSSFTYIYIYIYMYIWKKKTNKLQVHPYKPVSWSPTHQGI